MLKHLQEREGAIESLHDVLEQTREGAGSTVLLRGDAGVGKTALLAHAENLATGGFEILAARATVVEHGHPFAFAERMGAGAPATDWGAILACACERLAARANERPVALLLDDVQWADSGSLEFLGELAREMRGSPVAVLMALRRWPAEADALADVLAREGSARVLDIHPLGGEATAAFLRQRVDRHLDAAVVAAAWSWSGGNPLLLSYAAQALSASAGRPEAGLTRRPGEPLDLPDEALACLQAAAVLNDAARSRPAAKRHGIALATLQAIVGLSPDTFVASVELLSAARLLHVDDHGTARVAPTTGLQDATVRERLICVQRALDADVRAPVNDPLRMAVPLDHAQALGSDAVGQVAVSALVAAGPELTAAPALCTPVHPVRLPLRGGDLVTDGSQSATTLAGRFRSMGRELREDVRAELLLRSARAQTHAGRFEDACVTYDVLVRTMTGASVYGLQLERAHVVWELEGPAAGCAAIGAALTASIDDRAPGVDDQRHALRAVRSLYALMAGDPSGIADTDQLAEMGRRALQARPNDPSIPLTSFLLDATASGITERFDDACAAIEDGTAALGALGATRAAAPLRIVGVGIRLRRGNPREALAALDGIERELDLGPLLEPYVPMLRARALLLLGDAPQAAAQARITAQMPAAGSFFLRLNLRWIEAELLRINGRASEALDVYGEVVATVNTAELDEPCFVPWAAGAIEAALDAHRPDRAQEVVDWLERAAMRLPCIWPRAIALGGRAGIAAAIGDDDAAVRLYGNALALDSPAVLDRAAMLVRYGALLHRHPVSDPSQPLGEALRIANEQGALVLVQRATAALDAVEHDGEAFRAS